MNILKSLWKIFAKNLADLYVSLLVKGVSNIEQDKSILFIIPWLTFGGAEKVNLEIMEALKKIDWNILIVTTKARKHEWEKLFKKYSSNIFHIESIPQKLHSYIFLSIIRKAGIKVTFISNSFTGYLATPHISDLTKVIDLVHSEGGPDDDGGSPKFSSQFDQYINKRFVISDRLKNLYINGYKIKESKIEVIRNGIDVVGTVKESEDAVFPLTFNSIIERSHKVVWVGRMSQEKQPLEVIKLTKKMPDFYFVMIGDGDLHATVREAAKNISNLILLGQVENNVVKKIISNSDILIMTSLFEGVPIAILEAMALSKPVVATDVGAIGEIIINGENGYLVKPGKIQQDMPELIRKAYENKKELGEKAQLIVRNYFNLKLMQDRYTSLLEEIIK